MFVAAAAHSRCSPRFAIAQCKTHLTCTARDTLMSNNLKLLGVCTLLLGLYILHQNVFFVLLVLKSRNLTFEGGIPNPQVWTHDSLEPRSTALREQVLQIAKEAMHTDKISICIPLAAQDLQQFGILWRSLQTFLDFNVVAHVYIVTPDAQYDDVMLYPAIQQVVAAYHGHPCPCRDPTQTHGHDTCHQSYWRGTVTPPSWGLSILTDSSVVGEGSFGLGLASNSLLVSVMGSRARSQLGNHQQGLVKVSLAAHIAQQKLTQYVLFLDCDVILTKRLDMVSLFAEATDLGIQRVHANFKPTMKHTTWYHGAASVLQTTPLPESGPEFDVTPSIVLASSYAVMNQYIEELYPDDEDWRDSLKHRFLWNEYSLYYTFLSKIGLVDKLYLSERSGMFQEDTSVWDRDVLFPADAQVANQLGRDWARRVFCSQEPGLFVVFQDALLQTPEEADMYQSWIAPYLRVCTCEPKD